MHFWSFERLISKQRKRNQLVICNHNSTFCVLLLQGLTEFTYLLFINRNYINFTYYENYNLNLGQTLII